MGIGRGQSLSIRTFPYPKSAAVSSRRCIAFLAALFFCGPNGLVAGESGLHVCVAGRCAVEASTIRPIVTITYGNAGAKATLDFWLPDGIDEIELCHSYYVKIDGRDVEWKFDGGNPVASRRVSLSPGKREQLVVALDDACRIPSDWNSISIRAESAGGFYADVVGTFTFRRAKTSNDDTPRTLEREDRDIADTRVSQSSGLGVFPAFVAPVDDERLEAEITYCNLGASDIIAFELPKTKQEIASFRDLQLTVDGKPAPFVSKDALEKISRSRAVELRPGKNTSLRLSLKALFEIPTEWKKLELVADSVDGKPASLYGIATLERIKPRAGGTP